MSRIFICTHSQLPIGDANSNYIMHMGKALLDAGWDVYILGKEKQGQPSHITVDGIKVVNIALQKGRIPQKILGHFWFGREVIRTLEKYKVCAEDYILIYGGYLSLFPSIAYKLKNVPQNHISTCVVEWPTKDQFTYGKLDFNYLLWHRVFYHWMGYWKRTIVISDNLRRHFLQTGCRTFLLPPLIEYTGIDKREKNQTSKIKFIYSGADEKKDAIANMLRSIALLSEEERKICELHITGLKKEKAVALLGTQSEILTLYKESLVIHGWMEYNELLDLYIDSDYLLLARPVNQFTISNFPSKVPEMMNYGIIPVCSEVGDYTSTYLSNGKDCITFSGCSPEDCANIIGIVTKMSQEERTNMRSNVLKTAREKFDYRNYSVALSEFIKRG